MGGGGWDRPLRLRAVGLVTPVWMVAGGSLRWGGDVLERTSIAVFFVVVWALGVLIADRRAHAQVLEARTTQLVAIVDDQELVRGGFRALLDAEPGAEVVAEAATGDAAVTTVAASSPDVVPMDIRMPGTDGIEATRRIRAGPDPPEVLILTTFDTDDNVFDALEAGAAGFLVKDTPPAQLISAIRAALQALTDREREVLALVALGSSNREITARLTISELTAKTHVSRLLTKLQLASRVQAAALAYRTGLVRPGT